MEPDREKDIQLIRKAFTDNNIKVYSDKDLVLDKQIGEGSFGTVFKGTLDKINVAVKLLDKIQFETEDSTPEQTIKSIINELKAMTKIDHKQIPKFYGVYEKTKDKDTLFGLIFDFIDGVTLQRYLTDNKSLSNVSKCEILIGLVNVICDIHKNGVIHRDIKPENAMITPEQKVILLDFGISKISEKTTTFTNGRRMTVKYSPPEAILDLVDDTEDSDSKFGISKKFDVWSIGCVIQEVFLGIAPWSNKFKDENKILMNLQKGFKYELLKGGEKIYDFPFSKSFQTDFPEAFELANECLVREVPKRITSDEILIKLQNLLEFYKSKEK